MIKEPFRRGSKMEDKMKGWKILGVPVIVGIFFISMIPITQASPPAPTYTGDIIVAESSKWFDLYGWDHAALYKGSGKILEADPHFENWTALERLCYPSNAASLHDKSYSGNEHYGKVEDSLLTELWNSEYYSDRAYGTVIGASSSQRSAAVSFAQNKANRIWDVGNYHNKPRPFDYKSFWVYNTKQVDDTYKYSLGYGYYCSELVWAAWYNVNSYYNFDDDSGKITPNEIGNSNKIDFYGP